jgi:S-DNA-T family DNA segregation ATPase FtsK/SpoIIIE
MSPASIHLRAILQSKIWAQLTAIIPIVLGGSFPDNPMIHDRIKIPHLLIASATGSGKNLY